MPCSPNDLAKRALVRQLLSLAKVYSVTLQVNRDSPDTDVLEAYRRLLLKVHPDKGGRKVDFQCLQKAKEEWQETRAQQPKRGRPKVSPETPTGGAETPWAVTPVAKGGFRVNSRAVMLTYQGFKRVSQWKAFLTNLS